MDDKLISELLRKRDEDAIRCITEKYGRLIRKIVAGILSDEQDTEEAVNDTYMNIWESTRDRLPMLLSAYVCRVAKNTALKKVRYNGASKRACARTDSIEELAEILPETDSTESEYEEKLLTAALDDFLEGLPLQKRVVFVKRYWYYEPIEDIAKETGLKKGAVSTMLFRLRGELKEKLGKEGWFHD